MPDRLSVGADVVEAAEWAFRTSIAPLYGSGGKIEAAICEALDKLGLRVEFGRAVDGQDTPWIWGRTRKAVRGGEHAVTRLVSDWRQVDAEPAGDPSQSRHRGLLVLGELEANLKSFARIEDKIGGEWIDRQLREVRDALTVRVDTEPSELGGDPFEWADCDEDSRATLERYAEGSHPQIVAILKLSGGPDDAQVGIYVDSEQAPRVIDWLQRAFANQQKNCRSSATSEGEPR